jgi:hypothetical protein
MFVRTFFWILIFLILFGSCSSLNSAYCAKAREYISVFSESEAQLAVRAAEDRILVCYEVASDVANSGANVSTLLLVLNEAGALCSRAEMTYRNSDFDSATSLATLCVEKLDSFVDDARFLEQEASRQQFLDLVVLAASVVATIVVFVVSVVAWLVLNRKYGNLRVA